MMDEEGHDEESARAICGALEEEAKSDLGNVDELRESLARGRGLIADVGVDLVSAVDVPAIDSKWVMMKSDRAEFDKRADVPIVLSKADADDYASDGEKRISYAPAMIPRALDKEGDVATTPRVEKAAHNFLKQDGGHDTDHSLIDGEGETVESWVEKEPRAWDTPGGEEVEYPAGTWMLGIEWQADAWERIKAGELTGLSIYGMAEHVPLARAASDGERRQSLSATKSQEGYTFNTEGDGGSSMGEDTPTIDTEELAASLGESLSDTVGEAVKDAYEEARKESKEGDLSALIDDFVSRVADLDDVDKDAAELRDAIKAALSEESKAHDFAESIELDDAGVTVGFKDAAPEHVTAEAVEAAVADLLAAKEEDDDEDDEDEEEKAEGETESGEETAKAANLGKGGSARQTAAKGIENDATGGSALSYRALAEEHENGGEN